MKRNLFPLRALVLALLLGHITLVFDLVVANIVHYVLPPNCAASVEPASAVVDDCPFEITFITSSK